MWIQRKIDLAPRPRGFHLVTREVLAELPELENVRVGLLHLLILHTSASLALNENASPDVRRDFESWSDHAVPERAAYWTHTLEGPDDMPAHIKAALFGPSLTLPIAGGRPALGTWQGIYLCNTAIAAGAVRWWQRYTERAANASGFSRRVPLRKRRRLRQRAGRRRDGVLRRALCARDDVLRRRGHRLHRAR